MCIRDSVSSSTAILHRTSELDEALLYLLTTHPARHDPAYDITRVRIYTHNQAVK